MPVPTPSSGTCLTDEDGEVSVVGPISFEDACRAAAVFLAAPVPDAAQIEDWRASGNARELSLLSCTKRDVESGLVPEEGWWHEDGHGKRSIRVWSLGEGFVSWLEELPREEADDG